MAVGPMHHDEVEPRGLAAIGRIGEPLDGAADLLFTHLPHFARTSPFLRGGHFLEAVGDWGGTYRTLSLEEIRLRVSAGVAYLDGDWAPYLEMESATSLNPVMTRSLPKLRERAWPGA